MDMEYETLSLWLNIRRNVKCLKRHLYALPSLYDESDPNEVSLTSHILNAVLQNHEIFDFNYNWSQLVSKSLLY